MMRRVPDPPARSAVSVIGLALTAAAFVAGDGSGAAAALAGAGAVAALGFAVGAPGGVTLCGLAALGQLAATTRTDALGVLVVGVLLALLLGAAESVESGRWRAPAALYPHLVAVCVGVAGTAAALLVTGLPAPRRSAAAVLVVAGLVAAGLVVAAVLVRIRMSHPPNGRSG